MEPLTVFSARVVRFAVEVLAAAHGFSPKLACAADVVHRLIGLSALALLAECKAEFMRRIAIADAAIAAHSNALRKSAPAAPRGRHRGAVTNQVIAKISLTFRAMLRHYATIAP